jgi:hypothetical protein
MAHITLNHQVVFYVPSTKFKKGIDFAEHKKRTNEVASIFTNLFGGATIEKTQGFYKADNGEYITERINKVVSFCGDTELEAHTNEVLNLASKARKGWEQETIGLEIDGRFYLID